ncbi:MAG TPA: hypothetical protein VHZ03_35690 [Trebonia sp.]|nr:hypothetical protein [Trebonia sp.]
MRTHVWVARRRNACSCPSTNTSSVTARGQDRRVAGDHHGDALQALQSPPQGSPGVARDVVLVAQDLAPESSPLQPGVHEQAQRGLIPGAQRRGTA